MTAPVGRAPRSLMSGDDGQSTVELALALPAVTLLILFVVQVATVVHDRLLVDAAAREAVRAAAVTGHQGAAARAGATAGLEAGRLHVEVGRRPAGDGSGGALVDVEVRYAAPTDVPVVGTLLPDVDLDARATMRSEQP
jgi:Flp pilus assembly protein TadG